MKPTPKRKRPEPRFVIGYPGKGQCIYGFAPDGESLNFCDPMSLKQARKEVKELVSPRHRGVIFKLVRVKD